MEHTDPYIFEASLRLLARGYEIELIARMPDPDEADPDAEYEFFYGSRARALLEASRREGTATPWVALFRRRS
jgi:hypothetical protein